MQRILKLTIVVSTVIATFACNELSWGQSLFDRRDQRMVDMFSNVVARRKGDVLFVLITENTDVENRDERTLEREGSSDTNAGFDYALTGGLGNSAGAADFGQSTDGSRAFSGDSEFRSERQFQDRFAVKVVDVLPNRNLLVEGRRRIFLQGDWRTLQLSGIVRDVDLLPDNSVRSQMVADLEIRLTAAGPEEEFGKQGWLGRRLNWILPF